MIKFILGILFVEVGLPIVESAVELVQLAIENKKGTLAIEIAQKNKKVHEITGEENKEETVVHAIGFCAPSKDEEEMEEDEDF